MHLVYYLWRSENWLILKKSFPVQEMPFFLSLVRFLRKKLKSILTLHFF